jgi:hypothetical protein
MVKEKPKDPTATATQPAAAAVVAEPGKKELVNLTLKIPRKFF